MANETLVTISQRTGFSISTISRVLSGQAERYRISPATVQLIEEEAKRCNYIPNLLAKGLTTRRTNIIGLLIPSVDNPYFANIASVVIRQAKTQGFTTMVVDTMENEKNEQQDVLSLISRKVDGIIIVPCDRDPAFLERISKHNIPIVLIDRYFDATSLPYVCTDNYQGGYEATMHLIGLGHERIACIQGVPYSMPNKERVRGYREALRDHGIPYDERLVCNCRDITLEEGVRLTEESLAAGVGFDAVYAFGDPLAFGVLRALKAHGIRIPREVGVMGFTESTTAPLLTPSLTSVAQPLELMGRLSAELLLEKIEKPGTPDRTEVLDARINVRESTDRNR